jgi:TetR/AcrR family tetracycline transcriptional repressor
MAEITLSRGRILEAAIELVDRDGLRALNMRRLAAELGVGTMSLYHYVTDKEALLEGIAEVAMTGLEEPPPDVGWIEAVTVLSRSFRRIALDHPAVFPLLLGRKTPPAVTAAALQAGEVLRRHGFDDETAVVVFRVVVRFLIGWCLVETTGGPGGPRWTLTPEEADRQFSFALSALLRGLADSLPRQ